MICKMSLTTINGQRLRLNWIRLDEIKDLTNALMESWWYSALNIERKSWAQHLHCTSKKSTYNGCKHEW